ncbi:MAG: hypothetical protein IPM74_09160 [Crocinitomicaceae bacterium]|nr:hypothetical protein [Crocinitomicaceae bacterium]
MISHYLTKLILVGVVILGYHDGFSQTNPSDGCTGIPVLTVNANCTPTTYTLPGTYANGGLVNASCNLGTNMDDGWYQFTATNTTTDIDLTGSRTHTLSVWSACGGGTELACSHAAAGTAASVSFATTIGTVYYIQVHRNQSNNTSSMNGSICVHDPVAPANNCDIGIQVCASTGFPGNSAGFGTQELDVTNRGCLNSNEHQSSWYLISIGTAGTLQFTISPSNGTDDYDFALWGPSSACPPTAAPIRCSYAAGGGNTGLNTALNGAESPSTTEGSGGNRYVDDLTVAAGDVYLLVIDNFTSSLSSFNFIFGGSAGISCVPLPVVLVSLEAQNEGQVNVIKWQTKSESNNDFYTLERSTDGETWYAVGNIDGAGNSSETIDYQFRDFFVSDQVVYYQLWQTDHDGVTTNLGIVAVESDSNAPELVKIINLLGEEVDENYDGIQVYVYSDGSTIKRFRQK